jgi:hypothetical protein
VMAGSAQLTRSYHLGKLYKCHAINHLRIEADKAREGPQRDGASLLKSDGVLADMQNAMGRSAWCKIVRLSFILIHPPTLCWLFTVDKVPLSKLNRF